MKKNALLAILSLFVAFAAYGTGSRQQYDPDSDFTVSPVSGGVEISGYVGGKETVNIPPAINGTRVVGIGEEAFSERDIVNVTIPASVTSIGDFAFASCKSLASVAIPQGVTSIGEDAFSWCESLTSIMVAADNPNYSSEGGILFNKAKTALLAYPSASGEVAIPSGVTSIGNYAFNTCTSLTSVTIPASVTSIGEGTFSWCTSLTSVTIPAGVTSIGDYAFYDCTSLTNITIPASVTSIGDDAFSWCESLTSVTIPVSVTSIGNGAFYYWGPGQTITVEGYTSEDSADTAWGGGWRGGCKARIVYRG